MPYYPQGNGQAEAANRVILKILKKMKHEYGGEIECLLDKCTLGMQELLEDNHRIFTIFPNF